MEKKVIVAGHVCMDITLPLGGKKVSEIGQLLRPGKLFSVGEAAVYPGGVVANTGLALKLFDVNTALVGKLGCDPFGDIIYSNFAERDAESWLIREKEETSSCTVALAAPGIDRILLNHPGANDTFSAADLSSELLEGASLFHFGYPPLMRKMYENTGEELVAVLQKAKAAGAVTSLDLSMVDPDSQAGKANWKKILEKSLPYVDIFVPSAEELCYMLDREKYEALRKRAGAADLCELISINEDIRPLAETCMRLGVKILLIKCGAPGLYYRTASTRQLERISKVLDLKKDDWAEKEGFEASYIPEQVLSGTGAGDTSIAAFLASLLKGCGPEDCARFAAATGACCVSAYDALSGLKSLEELDKKIQSGWKKRESKGEASC